MSSRGVNRVILVGNLGQDPEQRHFPSGDSVVNVTLATSETWKDKQTGEQKEETEWHRLMFRGKLAEIVAQYLQKGSKIYVEGRLRTRKWQNQQGQDQYTTEILVNNMQMLDSRQDNKPSQQEAQQQPNKNQGSGANSSQGQAGTGIRPAQNYQQANANYAQQNPDIGFDDSDIPF